MFTGQNTLRYPTKWALNPSAYDNISADQVDWAALAQQWIQMKETCPPEMVPAAPPPPSLAPVVIRPPPAIIKDDFTQIPPAPAWTNPNWGFPQPPWQAPPVTNWGWNNPVAVAPPPPPPIANIEPVPKEVPQALLPTPSFNTFPPQTAPTYPVTQHPKGYWTIPEHGNSHRDKPSYKERNEDFNQPHGYDSGMTLDAAKRKQLPAWIRQGLEKMEKEKQKELERQQELEQRKIMLEQKRLAEEEALKELEREGAVGVIKKSKFDSDSEDEDLNGTAMSEDEEQEIDRPGTSKKIVKEEIPQIITPFRTKEEQLQDMMMCVRQTLTEILLEVTNDEILSISRDTVNRCKKTAQTLRKTNALASITGGLGLGIYGESSGSESENSDDDDSDGQKDQNKDSDVELEKTIQQRRAEFEKKSLEIESQLLEEELALKKRHKSGTPVKEAKRSDSIEEADSKPDRVSGDGEKCNKLADAGSKSSKPTNNHESSSNRNKVENTKVERDLDVDDKKGASRKKSKYQKSPSSQSNSDSGTDSETDSDSNTTRSESSDSSVESQPNSYEKKTNLCRKKSQKSSSPGHDHKKKQTDKEKSEKSKRIKYTKDDQFDIVSKDKSVKVSKSHNDKLKKTMDKKKTSARGGSSSRSPSCQKHESRSRESKRRSRSREGKYRSRSRESKRRSRSRDNKRRSRSRDERRRSRSRDRRRRSRSFQRRRRSPSRDSRYRSRSRSFSRDRKRHSRSRGYEKSYSSRDRRHRSRSNTSRRTRSRSRGKKSHRH